MKNHNLKSLLRTILGVFLLAAAVLCSTGFVSKDQVESNANYTSTQNAFCSGNIILTESAGTISDGSDSMLYSNNSSCSWLIQPTGASSISLMFSEFSTEANKDGVVVYDGANSAAPVLGQFSGSTLPSTQTSSSGTMYIEFLSDSALRGGGWTANYMSQSLGVEETLMLDNLKIYPNPSAGTFTIKSRFDAPVFMQIFNVLGKVVFSDELTQEINQVDASELSSGVYFIRFAVGNNNYTQRLIIE